MKINSNKTFLKPHDLQVNKPQYEKPYNTTEISRMKRND